MEERKADLFNPIGLRIVIDHYDRAVYSYEFKVKKIDSFLPTDNGRRK
jgi:hypothetical protein